MLKARLRSHVYSLLLHSSGRTQQLSHLKYLREHQFDSREVMIAEHENKIAKLLQFSLEKVPYYREEFSRLGLNAVDIAAKPMEVLHTLPLLDKTILRNRLDELKADDLHSRRWYYNTSGGSTGEPSRFVQDTDYSDTSQAGKVLFDEWTGYKPGMPKVVLWGSERDLLVGKETWRKRLGHYLRNEQMLNTFRMTEADMRSFVETINRVRPVQILAYVECVFEMARFIERKGMPVHSPNAVMTSAGTLYPHMREVIERVFSAPVFNRYGSREVGDIACECECHHGLHVNPYSHHVEILRDGDILAEPGKVGEVIVTSLINKAMPIIRYRIGDMAVWSERKCNCGRAWPLLKEVQGRTKDFFILANGSLIRLPDSFFYFKDWVQKFQFIQEDYEFVKLLVLPAIALEAAQEEIRKEKDMLEKKIKLLMGDKCKLQIDLVDNISPTPSGKYRYIISKVKPP